MAERQEPSPASLDEKKRQRLWAADRRVQLLETASALLSKHGVEGVRIPDVALAAGVTRPVVYKHFPNRQALIIGLLEAYGEEMDRRFRETLDQHGALPLERTISAIVQVAADMIEEKGPGVWNLLGSTGPDPEVDRVAQQMRARMTGPWVPRVQTIIGRSEAETRVLCDMMMHTTRAGFGFWLAGERTREETVETVIRALLALVAGFRTAA